MSKTKERERFYDYGSLYLDFLPSASSHEYATSCKYFLGIYSHPYREERKSMDPNGCFQQSGRVPQGLCPSEKIQGLGGEPHRQAQEMEKFFEQCSEIHHKSRHHSRSQQHNIYYGLFENPLIRSVKITISETFSDNSKHKTIVRGLLALKDDKKPRPLVIIKVGLFSSLSSTPPPILFFMHLFDEAPFNVLLLNSDTGDEYYIDNKRLSLGGLGEGRQLIQIAQWLRTTQSGLSNRISSLHMLGMSNGGHAVLYAAAYNGHSKAGASSNKGPLDSVTALCPMINFQRSTEYILRDASVFLSAYFRRTMKKYLNRAAQYVPSLEERIRLAGRLDRAKDIIGVYTGQLLGEYKGFSPEWYLPPFKDGQISTANQLYNVNNFIEKSSLVKIPTLVWSTKNDSVIEYSKNAGPLKAKNQNSKVAVLGTKYGNHCEYSARFGWSLTSRVLTSYILSNSPEFSVEKGLAPIELDTPTLRKGERHTTQEWSASKNSPDLRVTFYTYRKFNSPFIPFGSGEKAHISQFTVTVPYTKLLPLGITVPASDAEAQSLTRWLNINVELLTQGKLRLPGSSESPKYIRWQSR